MNRHKIIVFLTTVAILSTTIMPINVYASDDDDNNEELVTDEFVISDDRDYIPEIWAYESQPYPEDIELPRGCEFSDDSDEVIYYDNPSVDQGSMTIVIHSEEEKDIANEIMNSNTNIVDKAITLDDYGFDISCDVSYADDTYYQHDDIEESLKSDEPIGQRGIPVPETSGDYDDDIEYEEAKVSQRSNDKNTTENNDIISNETNEKIADNNIKISSENEIISYDSNSGKYNGCTWNYDPINKKLVIKSDTNAVINYTKDGSDFPWSKYKDEIEKIAIEGVSEIQANAFKDYPNVYKIYLNSSVTKLTAYAFTGCDSLTELYINGSPEVNENFFTYLNSEVTISCHYDMDANSIYNNCITFNRTFEVIEGFDPKNMNDVEYIYQMDPSIKNMTKGTTKWGSSACVVCTAAYMVERCAASNDYVGDYTFAGENGDGKTGAVALVKDITNKDVNNSMLYTWPTQRTYNEFTKDGKALNVKFSSTKSATEKDLQDALSKHPEGVLAHVKYNSSNDKHAVLVIGYNKLTKLYTILDVGHKNPNYINVAGYNGKFDVPFDSLSNIGPTLEISTLAYINSIY